MNDIFYWLEGLDDLSYNKIKDYITNLQQENERLKEELINSVSVERFNNIQIEMQKDIDFKQNRIIELENKYKKLFYKATPKYQVSAMEDYINTLEDYKSRCEKAIEYIEEMLYPIGTCVNGSDLPYESIESLLNILQNGSDKE